MNFGTSKLPTIIEAMLYIVHGGATPIGGKKLAEIMQLNPRYLEPCLQNLVKAGVLHSAKGAKGGYSLAVNAHELTVAQICENAIPAEEKPHDRQSILQQKIIAPQFKMAEESYVASLARLTMQDLCNQVKVQKLDGLLKYALNDEHDLAASNYAI